MTIDDIFRENPKLGTVNVLWNKKYAIMVNDTLINSSQQVIYTYKLYKDIIYAIERYFSCKHLYNSVLYKSIQQMLQMVISIYVIYSLVSLSGKQGLENSWYGLRKIFCRLICILFNLYSTHFYVIFKGNYILEATCLLLNTYFVQWIS